VVVGDGDEGNVCAICLSKIKPKDAVTTLECEHKFHTKCFWGQAYSGEPWANKCPICRNEVAPNAAVAEPSEASHDEGRLVCCVCLDDRDIDGDRILQCSKTGCEFAIHEKCCSEPLVNLDYENDECFCDAHKDRLQSGDHLLQRPSLQMDKGPRLSAAMTPGARAQRAATRRGSDDKENLRQLARAHDVPWYRVIKSHSGKKMRRPARARSVPRYRLKSRSSKKITPFGWLE